VGDIRFQHGCFSVARPSATNRSQRRLLNLRISASTRWIGIRYYVKISIAVFRAASGFFRHEIVSSVAKTVLTERIIALMFLPGTKTMSVVVLTRVPRLY
jgi:hypothetical protein